MSSHGKAERFAAYARDALSLDGAIDAATGWLEKTQHADGYWVGMVETNRCMESEWLLAYHFVGLRDDPKKPGMVRTILTSQRDDGAWETYYNAPMGDINTTVEAYTALRASGLHANSPPLRRAREWILQHGGLSRTRVFTRYWLSLIGEWPWRRTPAVPPEMIFLPRWFPFNIYNFASWARATMLPIAVLSSCRPVRRLPAGRCLDELFPDGRENMDYSLTRRGGALSWDGLFRGFDHLLHGYQQLKFNPGRAAARRQCVEWIVRHQDADGAWGGIQPPWVYSLMALNVSGFGLDHPVIVKGFDALNDHWSFEKDGGIHIQASESIVWDTLLAVMAMQDCDRSYRGSPAMQRAVEWILDQQVRTRGDWQEKVHGVTPGGWAFERANAHYPDVDDTAVALIVLARLRHYYADHARLNEALDLAVNWTLAMQCRNGGWGAFDRDNDHDLLTRIPFSDFGETLDPPSVDVTAHVIEALGLLGFGRDHPAVARACEYLRAEQESDGSWFGRWGVNHIYGTAAVLPALKAIGEDMSGDYVVRAGDWIASVQNDDGGWGETCGSYMDESLRGRGPSTASQTGWALMSLLAVDYDRYSDAIGRGVEFLLGTQQDGTWDEPEFTGTGFPGYGVGARSDVSSERLRERLQQGTELARGFMINYNLYRHYFPLMALGRARRAQRSRG